MQLKTCLVTNRSITTLSRVPSSIINVFFHIPAPYHRHVFKEIGENLSVLHSKSKSTAPERSDARGVLSVTTSLMVARLIIRLTLPFRVYFMFGQPLEPLT